MSKQQPVGFELSVSGRDDGTVDAMYIRFKRTKIAKSIEHSEDILIADYDARGELVGIEILAPVKLSQIVKIVAEPLRKPFKHFVKHAAPSELVCA